MITLTERLEDRVHIDKEHFVEALKRITIYGDVMVIAYRDGNAKTARGYFRMAQAVAATILIFTGRKVEICFTNIECTAYSIVEDKYGENETVLYSYSAPIKTE